jgi:hypothetical protein
LAQRIDGPERRKTELNCHEWVVVTDPFHQRLERREAAPLDDKDVNPLLRAVLVIMAPPRRPRATASRANAGGFSDGLSIIVVRGSAPLGS